MSRPTETLYATPYGTQRVKPLDLNTGEAKEISINWRSYLAYKDAEISTSTWEAESGSASSSGAANTDGVTSCTVSASSCGLTSIKNTVVLDNGETLIRKFRIRVTDPMTGFGWSDYGWTS